MEKLLDVEERERRGMENFKRGYNCAQSVVLAFADVYGLSEDMALRVSASFGAAIGRMRLTCGGANGMFQLVGLDENSLFAEVFLIFTVVQTGGSHGHNDDGPRLCHQAQCLGNAPFFTAQYGGGQRDGRAGGGKFPIGRFQPLFFQEGAYGVDTHKYTPVFRLFRRRR